MSAPQKLLKTFQFLENNEDLKGLFRYNLMSLNIEFTRKAIGGAGGWQNNKNLHDHDLLQIKYMLSVLTSNEYTKNIIEEAIILVSKKKSYHPLKDYLTSLKWDGVNRLDTWIIDYLGVEDNSYSRDVGRKILCGAVKRAFCPGCKFDYMLILEGEQGIGKSTLIENLTGQWYIDTDLSVSENRKDLVDTLSSGWIVEVGDLAGFNKSDVEMLRAFLTRKVDKVRLSYDKRVLDFPKQCILIGTHNPSGSNEYLKDDTGNRRFWPVECTKADYKEIISVRDQLFAEAVSKYENEVLFLDNPKSLEILQELHDSRTSSNPLKETIDEFVKTRDKVTANEIIREGLKLDTSKLDGRNIRGKQTLIGIWMRKNKWLKKGDTYIKPDDYKIVKEEIVWDN